MNDYKQIFTLLLLVLFLGVQPPAFAQNNRKVTVAVLCPLNIDEAFNGYSYTLGNSSMPQYLLTGLDFYNGVMLAVDSLNAERMNVDVWIYDTKKKDASIKEILQGMKVLNFSLIVASLTSGDEQKAVSDFSFANNIPVISVTYPNDAGVISNPYFIMLNSTLKTHVDGIYKYVQQNYASSKPVFITRTGGLEDKIKSDFKANDTAKNKLRYSMVQLNNDVYFDNIKPYLDSTRQNLVICGSLNSSFAQSLIDALGDNPSYSVTVIGMPNWDGFSRLYKKEYPNVDIVYSTPFLYRTSTDRVQKLSSAYRSKFNARPSDLVFKGFEAMYRYTHLAANYTNEFIGHVSDAKYEWNNVFKIKPVWLTSESLLPDYLENKNLYFIQKSKQSIVSVTQVRNDN